MFCEVSLSPRGPLPSKGSLSLLTLWKHAASAHAYKDNHGLGSSSRRDHYRLPQHANREHGELLLLNEGEEAASRSAQNLPQKKKMSCCLSPVQIFFCCSWDKPAGYTSKAQPNQFTAGLFIMAVHLLSCCVCEKGLYGGPNLPKLKKKQ